MTDWKKAYQNEWKNGVDRVKLVKQIMEDYGFLVESFADDALKDTYIPTTKHASGAPDLIVNKKVLVEVTGSEKISPDKDLWVRPDKFQYAEDNPFMPVWLVHVCRGNYRCIKLDVGMKRSYQTIYPYINGNKETYKLIPVDDTNIVPISTMLKSIGELNGEWKK